VDGYAWQEGVDWARSASCNGADAFRVAGNGGNGGVLLSLALCGEHVFCGSMDHTIRSWNRSSLRPGPILEGHAGPVCALTTWGGWLISGATDGALRAWNTTSGSCEKVWLCAHRSAVRSVVAGNSSANEGVLISTCDRGSVLLWRLGPAAAAPSTWRCAQELSGHTDSVTSALFLNLGWAATGSEDGTIRVWDLKAAPGAGLRAEQSTATATLECRSAVQALAYGEGLLFSATDDRIIRVWAESGQGTPGLPVPGSDSGPWVCVRKVRSTGVDSGLRAWSLLFCGGRLLAGVFGDPPLTRRELQVWGPIAHSTTPTTGVDSVPDSGEVGAAAMRLVGGVIWRLPQIAGATIAAMREGGAGEVWAAVGKEVVVWGRG
jgi:WD40 repeat protein